jgi:hypothetical protein
VQHPVHRGPRRADHRREFGLGQARVEHDPVLGGRLALGEPQEQLGEPPTEVEEHQVAVQFGEPPH